MRAGIDRDTSFGAVTPPLVLSSNFSFESFGTKRRYDYTRSGNPTRDLLAEALTELEGGAGAVITSSGMSAIALVLTSLLSVGDRLVVPHDAYGGSFRLFHALARKGHFTVDTTDTTDPRAFSLALVARPKVVFLETPSNPLLRITDLRASIGAAHEAGAIVVVDNTFLTPALQRPLALGADVVLHSTTKYINGHSDVVGGAVIARDTALAADLAYWGNALGLTGSPFDSLLTLRGLRTLAIRMKAHEANAHVIAERLAAHSAVKSLHYPGLRSHPGHAIAASQQDGFGGMISLELRGGETAARTFVGALRHFTLAESLGGVESLIAHPTTMTHASMTPEARALAGIPDGLLRLSVGIEAIDDLLEDLERALAAVERTRPSSNDALLA